MPSDLPCLPTDPPAPSAPVYRGYSQAELDAQYDQATLVPDISGYLADWAAESAARARYAGMPFVRAL